MGALYVTLYNLRTGTFVKIKQNGDATNAIRFPNETCNEFIR